MKTPLLAGLFLLSLCHSQLLAQSKISLPRATPEEVGVPAAAITAFLDSVATSKHEFQSFMLLRYGKVIAEGWWNPYRSDLKHTLYSLSKSFTATAVGFARAEQKLKLTDKVISFFQDQLPDSVSPYLQQLTIEDLLTMSVGQEPDPTAKAVSTDDWIKTFLALPIKYEPGSRFLYNSMATYMLSAIVQKATGQKILDFLQPRLFRPLGIAGIDWETDLHGINTGGWGLRLKTEDIAKFAQLFLQNGKWNGKQILPKNWAEEASSAAIIQHPQYSQEKQDSSDWEQGYGYQMWRCRHGAYRGDGAFGQYAIVIPGVDAVIAITSETMDMQGELDLIWKILLPAFHNGKLAPNKNDNAILAQKLASLSLPVKKESIQVEASTLNGKTFTIEPNTLDIQSMTFSVNGDKYQVTINTSSQHYPFNLAPNSWETGETTLAGPYLLSSATNNLKGLPPFKVASEYTWIDPNTLELVLRYTESPHTRTITCHFDGDKISVVVKRSIYPDSEGGTMNLSGVRK
jgi:CubicO group peptidase (beta-lactamase class C family)